MVAKTLISKKTIYYCHYELKNAGGKATRDISDYLIAFIFGR